MFSKRITKPTDTPFMNVKNKSIQFKSDQSNLSQIKFNDDKTILLTKNDGDELKFSENDKPVFSTATESVLEFSGRETVEKKRM